MTFIGGSCTQVNYVRLHESMLNYATSPTLLYEVQ